MRQLFDPESSTYSYLLADEVTKQAVLIDSVREQAERDLKLIDELGLDLKYVLETHTHADHVTGAAILRGRTGARTVTASNEVACADIHVKGGDRLLLGNIPICVLATPGHTDDSVSYLVESSVFTGDALFIRGTGRTDFQNGNAAALYESITTVLFQLPDDTLVLPGHDYRGQTASTIGEEKRLNPRLAGKSRNEFIDIMNNLHLPNPKKIAEAVPANRACGAD
jgi:glyoxylase-like metal-dependent hydrolase (beta-lactamase superfamily II)